MNSEHLEIPAEAVDLAVGVIRWYHEIGRDDIAAEAHDALERALPALHRQWAEQAADRLEGRSSVVGGRGRKWYQAAAEVVREFGRKP